MRRWIAYSLCFAALGLPLTGCGRKTPDKDAHEHEHAHEHGHEGPHGGHLLELGDEDYHAEWTHDDNGKIDIYVLDKDLKKDVAIDAEKLTIKTKVGDKAQDYDLEAANSAEGKASHFTITDKTLLSILTTAGSEATLDIKIDGRDFTQKIEAHSEHGHKH
jgi:hypothetical protein